MFVQNVNHTVLNHFPLVTGCCGGIFEQYQFFGNRHYWRIRSKYAFDGYWYSTIVSTDNGKVLSLYVYKNKLTKNINDKLCTLF